MRTPSKKGGKTVSPQQQRKSNLPKRFPKRKGGKLNLVLVEQGARCRKLGDQRRKPEEIRTSAKSVKQIALIT